jgi:hypothetical protein
MDLQRKYAVVNSGEGNLGMGKKEIKNQFVNLNGKWTNKPYVARWLLLLFFFFLKK